MSKSISLSIVLPVSAEALYSAWLSTRGHSAITGSPASVEQKSGGSFTAWDGYISGKTVKTEIFRRIVQTWRTTDFPEGSPDSRLEIRFEEEKGGTRLLLEHTGLPDGMEKEIEKGWKEYYFKPMKKYFARRGREKWEDAFGKKIADD
jgi:activator of HSP90 ATPase